jgi:hypothetical protein
MNEPQCWSSTAADICLRSEEGGRAFFWLVGTSCLAVVEDPAVADLTVTVGTIDEIKSIYDNLCIDGWEAG